MPLFTNLQVPLFPNYGPNYPGDLLSVNGNNIYQIGNINCDGHYIYVALPSNNPFAEFQDYNGNGLDVYVSPVNHHDDLAMGAPVSYAGTLDFNHGVLSEWSNHSGHYQPLAICRDQAPTVFDVRLFAVVVNDGSLASFNPQSPNYVG